MARHLDYHLSAGAISTGGYVVLLPPLDIAIVYVCRYVCFLNAVLWFLVLNLGDPNSIITDRVMPSEIFIFTYINITLHTMV